MKNKFIVKYKKIGGTERVMTQEEKILLDVDLVESNEDIKDRNNKEEEQIDAIKIDDKKNINDIIKETIDGTNKNEKIDLIKDLYGKMVMKNNCLINPILCKEIPSIIKYLKMYNVKDFNNNDFFSDGKRFLLNKFNSKIEMDNFKRNDANFNQNQNLKDSLNQIIFKKIISRYLDLNDLSLNKLNLVEYKNRGKELEVDDDLIQLNTLKHNIFEEMRAMTKSKVNEQNTLRDNLINTMFLYGIPSNNITIPFLYHFDKARKIIKKIGFNTPIGMTSVLEFKDIFDIEDNLKIELIKNNDINKVLMTWSENTIDMFEFKDERNLNKFEFLFLIQWILYGMEEPDYEKLDNIYSDHLEEYISAFRKGVNLSINNVQEKFDEIEKSDVMVEIDELRDTVKQFKIKNMKIIFSHDYIFTRFIGLPSFVPFKYWKMDSKTKTTKFDEGKCNNGSLCCESKLFSYIFDKYNVKSLTEIIKGETCYWMSKREDNQLANDTTAQSYSFVLDDDNENLVRKAMCQIINIPDEEEYLNLSKRFALPCPGCQMNYFNYLTNKRISWSKKEECFAELEKFNKLKNEINAIVKEE